MEDDNFLHTFHSQITEKTGFWSKSLYVFFWETANKNKNSSHLLSRQPSVDNNGTVLQGNIHK